MAHRVTLIPGDGTGPELAEATRRVLDATGVEFDWDVQQAGADVMDEHGGNPLPDHVLESIRENGVALKGPITTPVGTGFRSVNVALRKTLDLYGQVRPCKSYEGVRSRYSTVDLVVIRENTEDLYAGIEFEEGTEHASALADWIEHHGQGRIRADSGISIKPISVSGTRRIVEFAFDYARTVHDDALTTAVCAKALEWFADDRDVPAAWEPSGADFLSPALVEAELMRRILPADAFASWLAGFLPDFACGEPATLFMPVDVSDRGDPQLVHLDGLNLSRAWCLRGIANALSPDDVRHEVVRKAADAHLAAGWTGLASSDFAGAHWLASFAMLALDA